MYQLQPKDSQELSYHNTDTRDSYFTKTLIESSYPAPRSGVKVFCCDPRVIVNTKLPEFFLTHCEIRMFDVDGVEVSYSIPSAIIKQPSIKVKKSDLLRWLRAFIRKNRVSFFVDCEGEYIESTMYVECGHCQVCLERKRHHFTSLCTMEAQQHDSLPLFITLTYHDDCLPEKGLNNIDVQKYLKRVRRGLDKRHIIHNLKYAYCGEYGPSTGRPHYHLLLYGFPSQGKFKNYFEVDSYLRKKWNFGFVLVKPVTSIDGVSKYIGKYMTKAGKITPDFYDVRPFVRHSTNMGVSFVKKVAEKVIDNGYQQIQYKDKFSGKLSNLPLTKYYINKVMPGISQLNVEVRNSNLIWKSFEEQTCLIENYLPEELKPQFDESSYISNQLLRDKWYNGLFEALPEVDPHERAYALKIKNDKIYNKQTLL